MPSVPAEPDAQFQAAQRLYAEQWGDAVVTNTYLKLTIAALCILCFCTLLYGRTVIKHIDSFKPLVVRIDQVGRAEAIKYDNLNYKPQDAEIKYFLSNFCRLYYGRNHYTIKDNFQQALLFMDSQLANTTLQAWAKTETINKTQEPGHVDQEVQVTRVDIEDLRSAPYKATVLYDLVSYSTLDHSETSRAHYTAHFVFAFRETVPNDLIQTNPLGMSISYFREDESFN
jgi:type IV secretion system protein VirB5